MYAGSIPTPASRHHCYIELHIEQGPVLDACGIPVGVVTAIRGALRGRSCRCVGAYTHSGAVPHDYRSDAVMATVDLVGSTPEAFAAFIRSELAKWRKLVEESGGRVRRQDRLTTCSQGKIVMT